MPLKWTRMALAQVGLVKWLLLAAWLLALVGAALGWWRPRSGWWSALVASVLLQGMVLVWARWRRERWIREAPLPQFLKRKLRETYPDWSGKDLDLVERGLRQFFLACLRSRGQFVAMPSKAVDALWHEFILHTHAYGQWCDIALGRFLHHTPAEALGPAAHSNDGLRRAWLWACRDESIDPRQPSRLPLLFALDAKLAVPGGFQYLPDANDIARKQADAGGCGGYYAGTSFSDGSACGDNAGFGGMDAGGGADGGDGGGCGGD